MSAKWLGSDRPRSGPETKGPVVSRHSRIKERDEEIDSPPVIAPLLGWHGLVGMAVSGLDMAFWDALGQFEGC